MKRVGNLFDVTFTRESLYQAYLTARKGKRSKEACFRFEVNLGTNLEDLYRRIHDGTYRPDAYYKFIIYEPKKRTIYGPSFRDIVVQHAIYRVIYPIFNRTFIHASFACRKGYGTHRANRYAQRALRRYPDDVYSLKLDIRKFFYSIDRALLRKLLERKIKDSRFVDMMMLFADYESPVGIPIGNLLSQIFALIYLNPLDHFVKRGLKVRVYCRYVDDFILFGLSKAQCIKYKERIVRFLTLELGLVLSKWTLAKIKKGVNFVGYRTWKSYKLIRKYSLYKFKRLVKKGKMESIISSLGHAKGTQSLLHMIQYLTEAFYVKDLLLPKVYRQIYHAYGAG